MTEHNTQRNRDGRYSHGLDAVCECGHRKGEHIAGDERGAYECCECDCEKFKKQRASRNT